MPGATHFSPLPIAIGLVVIVGLLFAAHKRKHRNEKHSKWAHYRLDVALSDFRADAAAPTGITDRAGPRGQKQQKRQRRRGSGLADRTRRETVSSGHVPALARDLIP
jgi:hypothetical protein